ncbi:MAG: hypothetical protein K2P45_13060 [Eubacterium sp.]|nr:hypothetical protein [Eubacterium sp.]
MKKKNVFLNGLGLSSLLVLLFTLPVHAAALEVQTSDVITVLKNCAPYFAALVVILLAAVAYCVFCRKYEKRKRKFFRGQAFIVGLHCLMMLKI